MNSNILGDFASVVDAVQCGVAIQRELTVRNAALLDHRKMLFRIGINLGDVLAEGERIYGDGVNIAARMEGLAEGGGICLSGTAYDQVENKLNLEYVYLGEQVVKNIARPVRVYRVVMEAEARDDAKTAQVSVQAGRRTGMKVSSARDSAKVEQLSVGKGRRIGLIVGVVVVVLGIIGVTAWQGMRLLGPDTVEEKKADITMGSQGGTGVDAASTKEAASLDKRRIAVLPFVNMSADTENEYFSDGMTEELISKLSRLSGLTVIARTSVMKYKGTNKDVGEIGRALGAGTLLEGSVRKAGEKLRITVQLIDVASQGHLWAQDYNRELKEVFAIQSDVGQHVAAALQVALLAREKEQVEKKGTENLKAYNLYLKGLYHFNKLTKEGLERAIEYFKQAIDKDPTYAQAYTWLAESYQWLGVNGQLPTKEAFPKAEAAVRKALELDNTIPEPHLRLGFIRTFYDWDWSAAERGYKRALELNPNSAYAHNMYGIIYLTPMGRHEEGITELKRALELDPLSISAHNDFGWAFVHARQHDQAIEQFQKLLEMEPNLSQGHWGLGEAYLQKGMYKEAIAEMQKMVDLAGGSADVEGYLGWAYGVAGQRDEALKVLDTLKERAKQEPVDPTAFAFIYAGLGEKDQAIEWLQKAYEEPAGSWELMWLKVEFMYDSLRSDPRFTELLKKVGLAE
jgi:adenylate cyclase